MFNRQRKVVRRCPERPFGPLATCPIKKHLPPGGRILLSSVLSHEEVVVPGPVGRCGSERCVLSGTGAARTVVAVKLFLKPLRDTGAPKIIRWATLPSFYGIGRACGALV